MNRPSDESVGKPSASYSAPPARVHRYDPGPTAVDTEGSATVFSTPSNTDPLASTSSTYSGIKVPSAK